MRVASIVAIVLALALAGCGGPADPAPALSASATPRGPSAVDAGAGSGILSGLVTDAELVPLADAFVQVLHGSTREPATAPLSTDADGAFEVRGLAAGDYLVYASRIGYGDASPQRATVASDETTRINIVLEPLAVLEAHQSVFSYVWMTRFAQADREGSGGQGNGCIGCSGKDEGNYTNDEDVNGPLDALVVEARFTANNAVCDPEVQTDVFSPDEAKPDISAQDASNPYYWNNEPNVTNPTRLVITRQGQGMHAILGPERTEMNKGVPLTVEGRWNFHTQLYATPIVEGVFGFSCAYELRVETWVTAFHLGLPDPDYTVFPDG